MNSNCALILRNKKSLSYSGLQDRESFYEISLMKSILFGGFGKNYFTSFLNSSATNWTLGPMMT